MEKYIKTPAEIETIAEGGRILREILTQTAALAKSGVTTADLNVFAERQITKAGGRPSFRGYGDKHNPFPGALCTSINDVVVHGIPSQGDVLQTGDLLGLDIGMEYKKLYTDTAITIKIGEVSQAAASLVETTRQCLESAIDIAVAGKRMGDIGYVIQKRAEAAGFSVVRDLVGHGVGYAVHEDPMVPGYGKPGTGILLKAGMVLAIEPMLCQNDYRVYFDDDGWTIRTQDGGLAAHFEHTIAVGNRKARILT